MSNRSLPDPVEATFRDLRGAVYTGDGPAAMAAIERRPDLDTLQYAGDGLLFGLAQGVTGAAERASEHISLLRGRGLDGDEDLAVALEAMLGLAPIPALRDLPVDLDEFGEPDDEADDAEAEDGPADERWLRFDSLGSRPGFRDMEAFLDTVADERLATRLDRALGGRGAFRRFKDELSDAPGELDRFYRFTGDRSRGRARQWLAESGLRPSVPAEPPSPDRPDCHGLS